MIDRIWKRKMISVISLKLKWKISSSLPYVHTARNFIVLRMCGQNNILWILCRCVIVRRQWTNLKWWRRWIIRLYIFRLNINCWSSWWEFFTNGAGDNYFFRILIGHIIIGIRSCRWIRWSCCGSGWSFRWSCLDWGDGWQNSWSVCFRYCKLITLSITIYGKIVIHSLLKQAGSNSLHCPDSKHVNVFGPSNLKPLLHTNSNWELKYVPFGEKIWPFS